MQMPAYESDDDDFERMMRNMSDESEDSEVEEVVKVMKGGHRTGSTGGGYQQALAQVHIQQQQQQHQQQRRSGSVSGVPHSPKAGATSPRSIFGRMDGGGGGSGTSSSIGQTNGADDDVALIESFGKHAVSLNPSGGSFRADADAFARRERAITGGGGGRGGDVGIRRGARTSGFGGGGRGSMDTDSDDNADTNDGGDDEGDDSEGEFDCNSEPRASSRGTSAGEKVRRERERSRSTSPNPRAAAAAAPLLPDQEERKNWLMSPLPSSGRPLQCRVVRVRDGLNRLSPLYQLWLDSSASKERPKEGFKGSGADFLMAAKKKAAKATPYLLVSMEREPEDRGSNKVLGKVRGNAVGSQYSIVDSGMAPGKTSAPSTIRRELGTVKFEYLNSSPSHMECYLPAVARQPNPQPGVGLSGADRAYSPELKGGSGPGHGYMHDDGYTEMAAAVADKNFKNMCRLENIKAKWDEIHGGHVLNFNGRVTESSVKNFQLKVVGRYGSNTVANQCVEDETVVLQFGRVGKNEFTMDVRWPLSPFQAFSICAACIDDKIADRRGYAMVKKWTGI